MTPEANDDIVRSETLSTMLSFLSDTVSGCLTEKLNENLKQSRLNISLRNFYLMVALDELGAKPQAELAKVIGTNNNTMVQLIDELEELNYAVRNRNPENRRQQLVTLTNDGARVLRKAKVIVKAEHDKALHALTNAERTTLSTLLLKLQVSLP